MGNPGLEESKVTFTYRSIIEVGRRARSITVASVLLLLILTIHAFAAMVTGMEPYVQAVTTNSIYVLVECDSTSAATVQFGLTNGYGSTATTESSMVTTASPLTYVHRIKLAGLSPNTQYHYRASHAGGAWSADSTFYTAVLPGTPFRFAAYADTRTQTTVHNNVASRVKTANPRFQLVAGDLCNDSLYETFKSEWFLSNELALQALSPAYNAPGNHEEYSTNSKAFFQSPSSSSGVQDYYSFDYGDVHIVSINNQATYTVNSTQYNWVANDLATTTKPWKIVFFHRSAYVAGGHGEDATMIQWSNNIFVPKNVDLVITGHSHFYQHNLVSGINHYVLGTAGAPFATLDLKVYVIRSALEYHYGILDVTPTSIHMDVITDGGALLDKLDLVKSVSAAKAKIDGTLVDGTGLWTVTHVPSEAKVFYVQDALGVAGIRVETSGTKPAVGATVLIRGTLGTTAAGERVIQSATVTSKGTVTSKPRGMNNRAADSYNYILSKNIGVPTQGMLVKLWGQVTKSVTDPVLGPVFWLDDGAKAASGEPDGTKGLKVIESGLSPAVNSYLKIAGVVSTFKVSGQPFRMIRYRESLP